MLLLKIRTVCWGFQHSHSFDLVELRIFFCCCCSWWLHSEAEKWLILMILLLDFYLAICNLALWDTLKINTQSKDIPMMHVFVTAVFLQLSLKWDLSKIRLLLIWGIVHIYFLMDDILVKNWRFSRDVFRHQTLKFVKELSKGMVLLLLLLIRIQ